jgi:hypothetical protein
MGTGLRHCVTGSDRERRFFFVCVVAEVVAQKSLSSSSGYSRAPPHSPHPKLTAGYIRFAIFPACVR